MKLLAGIELALGNKRFKLLKLPKSLYGLKTAGKTWFDHLSHGLRNRGFEPSQIDPCVFIGKIQSCWYMLMIF